MRRTETRCRVCQCTLVAGENWAPSLVKRGSRICGPCKYRRDVELRKLRPPPSPEGHRCRRCKSSLVVGENWPEWLFHTYNKICLVCQGNQQAENARRNPAVYAFAKKQRSARARGVPFTISLSDVDFPDTCPALGIPLIWGIGTRKGRTGGRANSPSFDRLDPTKGYVPGNVVIISNRANTIKQDASSRELQMMADWLALMEKKCRSEPS